MFHFSLLHLFFRWSKGHSFSSLLNWSNIGSCLANDSLAGCGICSQSHGVERYRLNLEGFKVQLIMVIDRVVGMVIFTVNIHCVVVLDASGRHSVLIIHSVQAVVHGVTSEMFWSKRRLLTALSMTETSMAFCWPADVNTLWHVFLFQQRWSHSHTHVRLYSDWLFWPMQPI